MSKFTLGATRANGVPYYEDDYGDLERVQNHGRKNSFGGGKVKPGFAPVQCEWQPNLINSPRYVTNPAINSQKLPLTAITTPAARSSPSARYTAMLKMNFTRGR